MSSSRPPETQGERGPGWRQGVLDAAEFLRQVWDDGEQGNANGAAELVLLREYADRAAPPSQPEETSGEPKENER